MHCYESGDGLPLAAVTVRRFKLLLKRIWVKVMFYNVLSHMHYFQASSVLHWFLVKCLIASWMQYNSVLFANMVYISEWSTALTVKAQDFLRIWKEASVGVFARVRLRGAGSSALGVTSGLWEQPTLAGCLRGHRQVAGLWYMCLYIDTHIYLYIYIKYLSIKCADFTRWLLCEGRLCSGPGAVTVLPMAGDGVWVGGVGLLLSG